jgi:uncharacterized membrane protein YccC
VEILVSVAKPTARIIHLADWHCVPKELFAADLEQAYGRKLTEAERDAAYRQLLLQVEVQAQQIGLLRCLVKHHGLKSVFKEGVTQNKKAWDDQIEALRGVFAENKEIESQLRDVRALVKTSNGDRAAKAKETEMQLLDLRGQQVPLLLQVGAPGRMLLGKEIECCPWTTKSC